MTNDKRDDAHGKFGLSSSQKGDLEYHARAMRESIEKLEREFAETEVLVEQLIQKAQGANTVEELREVVVRLLKDVL